VTAKQYLELFAARAIFFLPISWASEIGAFFGRKEARRAIKLKLKWVDRLHNNFEQLQGVTRHEDRELLIIAHIEHIGRLRAETPILHRIDAAGRLEIRGQEHLELLKGQCIIICVHTGHWELITAVLKHLNFIASFLYEEIDNKTHLKIALETRKRICPEGQYHYIPGSPIGARKLVTSIKNGENLAIFIDEQKQSLSTTPSFGRCPPVTSNISVVARLAIKYNLQILPLHIKRKNKANFTAIIDKPINPKKFENSRNTPNELKTTLNNTAESWILEDISQWYWLAQLDLGQPQDIKPEVQAQETLYE
jgi:KDO2-lipid IV(A) lauroyltransferase